MKNKGYAYMYTLLLSLSLFAILIVLVRFANNAISLAGVSYTHANLYNASRSGVDIALYEINQWVVSDRETTPTGFYYYTQGYNINVSMDIFHNDGTFIIRSISSKSGLVSQTRLHAHGSFDDYTAFITEMYQIFN